jgi:hypothetical protein
MKLKIYLLLIFFGISFSSFSQEYAFIFGKISDDKGKALDLVNIAIWGQSGGTSSDKDGNFELRVPANKENRVIVSFIGFKSQAITINLNPGVRRNINFVMQSSSTELDPFVIQGNVENRLGFTKINPKEASLFPTPSGSVEALIKTQMGVSSSNELSSQYNVRGGNYDENLIYVNGIEIYRPFLIRAGQQEGLSFLNSDLVKNIHFSAGGFAPQYGDKMSSVLDIEYKNPDQFAGSASASLLGGTFHVEDMLANKKTSYLVGVRYRSNSYLLNSMETKGDYRPSFADAQALISHKINDKWDVNFLGHYSNNTFNLVPQTRETSFGTIQQALKLKIFFDGQEIDKFETMTTAFYANWKPRHNSHYKFIASYFNSFESETYDIQGQYWLDDLETDFGKDNFGDATFNRGVGTFLEHARNQLTANVANFEVKNETKKRNHTISWGLKYQFEHVDDKLREWRMNDSAGYITPHFPDIPGQIMPVGSNQRDLKMTSLFISDNILSSSRISGYIQDQWKIDGDSNRILLVYGARFTYWDVNNQFLISPRATLFYRPSMRKTNSYRFSSGIYQQPPFYRELRNMQGDLNLDVKSQTSIHFVLGYDAYFKAWDRPFKFTTEVYYKHLLNLIPYEIDNVRIRYYAENNAKGYAGGIDMKVIGEFVPGIDSWFTLSVMQTNEDILNDYRYTYFDATGKVIRPSISNVPVDSSISYPGFIPRPTDQRVNVNLFFQDYIPNNPMFKMHLNLAFGTGLPFGAPGRPKYTHTFRMPPYRRVDIGFSAQLLSEAGIADRKGYWKHLKSSWISLEVFNLLQISNTVSYIWITDIYGNRLPVPNYLTPRMINAKLLVEF